MGRILVVDDEAGVLASIEKLLSKQGHEVVTARSAESGLEALPEANPDVMLMDIRLPGMSGLDAFRRIRELRPKLPVIIMTGYGTTESTIDATKLGAFEYVIKPFQAPVLLRMIDQALECVRLMQGHVALARMADPPAGDTIIGDTEVMQEMYKAIGRVAPSDATVLVRGETGTGKELVARAVYQHSRRKDAPLLLINCAAVPEALLESELFGHERGAFTGAASRRIGKLEQANRGTVFLDEIGDIPPGVQVKILRVLQEREFERVGGNDTIEVDVRIVAATNRNLEQAIADGSFRQDLYHRLNVVTIHVPALRDRREDIPLLTNHFLARFARQLQIERPAITEEALRTLCSYSWPGNVRELEHCVHRTLIFTRGYPIQDENVRQALDQQKRQAESGSERAEPGIDDSGVEALRAFVREYLSAKAGASPHREVMETIDRLLVVEALRLTHGNQTHAARLLDLTRPTLQGKMQRYGIRRETSVRDD